MISYDDLAPCGIYPGWHGQERAHLALHPRILCLQSPCFSCDTMLIHPHLLFGNIRVWWTYIRMFSIAVLPTAENSQYDKNAISCPSYEYEQTITTSGQTCEPFRALSVVRLNSNTLSFPGLSYLFVAMFLPQGTWHRLTGLGDSHLSTPWSKTQFTLIYWWEAHLGYLPAGMWEEGSRDHCIPRSTPLRICARKLI